MTLDADSCYRALRTRDARFDGRFFTAVSTTGIYCRPICPARTPRRRHVRFFPTAAAAAEAGFRACQRCHPESAPGGVAWCGSSPLVTRALRLISEGALDEGTVQALSERLGVGSRQLGRLFRRHVGAPPVVVAQTRRVHFARKLIAETELSMTQVAWNAGYSSIRRFNAAVKQAFGRSPRDLRRRGEERAAADRSAPITLGFAYRPPFLWSGLVAFLRPRATPGVEEVRGESYRRSVGIGKIRGWLEVADEPARHRLRVRLHLDRPEALLPIGESLQRLFDLAADSREIAELLARDPLLADAVTAEPGLRVAGAFDGFEVAVRAILGQQVSVAAATTLAGRLVRELGRPVAGCSPGTPRRLFPEPAALAEADLTRLGILPARATALRLLARAVADGSLALTAGADVDGAREKLREIPGVGPWTVEYIAMRVLRDPDAFPAGDLALRRAATETTRPLTASALELRAEAWRPWRAYAAAYLWRRAAVDRQQTIRRARRRPARSLGGATCATTP